MPKTIDTYINGFPSPIRDRLETIRRIIRAEAPDAGETIKYGMPTFTLDGNLVYFGAWAKHIGIYPISADMETAIEGLSNYKTTGKGTVQFPHSLPLPETVIRQIVRFRVREQLRLHTD